MSARITRQEARDRATKVFMASREKIIPANESVPLKGSIFRDWEDQVEVLVQQVVPTLLEERLAFGQDSGAASSSPRPPIWHSIPPAART